MTSLQIAARSKSAVQTVTDGANVIVQSNGPYGIYGSDGTQAQGCPIHVEGRSKGGQSFVPVAGTGIFFENHTDRQLNIGWSEAS